MKPPNYKTISHYDNGQPWTKKDFKPKEEKPQPVVLHKPPQWQQWYKELVDGYVYKSIPKKTKPNPVLYKVVAVDPSLREQVQELLAQPHPKFDSPLILPKAFLRQQEADRHVERVTEFIEQQIERKCEPLAERYETWLSVRESKIVSLREEIVSLNEAIDGLQQQVAQLQARRLVVESRTVAASSYRRFRVED